MSRLQFLYPGWWAVVMGLAGLTLAWHRAHDMLGEWAQAASLALAILTAVAFIVLALASFVRFVRHLEAWREDARHPVRHVFLAAIPISMLLAATVAVALDGPSAWAAALWWAGSIVQLAVTVWVLGRWWRGNTPANPEQGVPPGLAWPGVTPALFIPVVGNVVVPLAGVPLGFPEWSAAQFGVGLFFWPVALVLVILRGAIAGPLPDRLLPTAFITVAPPAVIGLSLAQFGAPPLVLWTMWGIALFSLLWAGTLAKRIAALPFAMPHWALSFPLAAFAALTLRVAPTSGAGSVLALAALALASLIIAGLVLATLRGLAQGTLLVAEAHPAVPSAANPELARS
ncbi:MAG: SLAC1 anion channel family protein [Casimicrobiaceae bacterium]|nr:SLAC1 anion channel family protein [Casimicrobiaceae bacterium]MDW8312216.1 SLAC1 anion channel family protein [Burkholderiales bacterium]